MNWKTKQKKIRDSRDRLDRAHLACRDAHAEVREAELARFEREREYYNQLTSHEALIARIAKLP